MSLIIETQYGRVEGRRASGQAGCAAFLGIPYAKPPLGALRFRPPEPPEPWSSVRPAHAYGASAMQGLMFAPGVLAEGKQSEDCLYLNVFTPQTDGSKRPVLFWIHGGAFTVGSASSPLYDGAKLAAQHDVVVVTINYRIGALGYLSFGEEGKRWGAVDNRGQYDQLAALRWVRDNIERFGGDPGNVTLFGESAGGGAVCLLVAIPAARGLFHRAISQSSAIGLKMWTSAQAAPVTRTMLGALELSARDAERMNELPIEQLMAAQARTEADERTWPQFYPVMDGELIPAQPGELLALGQSSQVPLLIGVNRDEWNLFALMQIVDWSKPLDDAQAIERFRAKLPPEAAHAAPLLYEVYRASRKERGLAHGGRALLRALEGDLRFRLPSLRFAEQHVRQGAPTYSYLFSYESPALMGTLGACHALELPFVFGTYDKPNQDKFVGAGEVVEQLSATMRESWVSFARSGKPAAAAYGAWPEYELTRRQTVEFAANTRVVDDPYGEERKAWEGLV